MASTEVPGVYRLLQPERTAEAFLEWGRLQNEFARIRCAQCTGEATSPAEMAR